MGYRQGGIFYFSRIYFYRFLERSILFRLNVMIDPCMNNRTDNLQHTIIIYSLITYTMLYKGSVKNENTYKRREVKSQVYS